jgi:hypothetical protein
VGCFNNKRWRGLSPWPVFLVFSHCDMPRIFQKGKELYFLLLYSIPSNRVKIYVRTVAKIENKGFFAALFYKLDHKGDQKHCVLI